MLQEQYDLKRDRLTPEIAPEQKLQSIVAQALETLRSLLNSEEISVQERAAIALKILETVGSNPLPAPQLTPMAEISATPAQPAPQLPSPATDLNQLEVTLLLTGGHQYTMQIKLDDPMLENLFKVMLTKSQSPTEVLPGLFQIALEDGRVALCFPSRDLIGVTTEPALFIKTVEDSEQPSD